MGLSEQQRLLARVYTDAEARTQFVQGEANETFRNQVNLFARSLVRKRLAAVAKSLPRTSQALGRAFGELFFIYVEDSLHSAEDTIGFARFLQKRDILPEVRDLTRFEASCLEATRRTFMIRCFRCSIGIWFRFGSSGRLHFFRLPMPYRVNSGLTLGRQSRKISV